MAYGSGYSGYYSNANAPYVLGNLGFYGSLGSIPMEGATELMVIMQQLPMSL